MRILSILTAATLSAFIFTACSSRLPKTPEDALSQMKSAYNNRDAKKAASLMSRQTIESFRAAARDFSVMDEKQRGALYAKGAIPKKDNISAEDLIRHDIEQSLSAQDNPLYTALNRPVIAFTQKDGRAVARTTEGIELVFIKEGSYWKFSPKGK